MKNKKLLLCLVLVIVLVMTGSATVFANTGDNYTILAVTDEAVETPAPEEEPDPPSIIIQDYPASMEVGESTKLSYALNNTSTNEVSWKSSDSDIISIDADGNVTANATGTAKITATAGKATDSIKISVKEVPAESIKIVSEDFGLTDNVTGHQLKKGDTVKLQVEAKPKEATVSGISWEVDDPEIAEIDSGGTLVALKNGKVKVTASTDEGLSAELEIQVGSSIPWVLIAIIAAVVIVIIILITLIIRMKRRSRPKRRKNSKYDDDDDYDEDEDYDDKDTDDEDEEKKKQEELEKEKERIRQEAYRKGFADRDKEMTKVFDPKDFEFKDDDIE